MIAHGVIELVPHVVAELVLQSGFRHLADPSIQQRHFPDLRGVLCPEHGVHFLDGGLDLNLDLLGAVLAEQPLEVSRHGLGELRLDLVLGVGALVHAEEVDEDAGEEGIEFLCGSCDLQRDLREVVVVLLADVVDLAQGVLADVPLFHPQDALQADVGQLRVGPQDVRDCLDLVGRHVGLDLPVDGKPEGALVEHEVQLHAERHLLSALPA